MMITTLKAWMVSIEYGNAKELERELGDKPI